MGAVLHKKSILKKTLEVGGSTLLSRFFGIIREVLLVRFLGAGALSDAFLTAYKIPNSLRKIFAEGALSAAFIPTLVGIVRKDRSQANSLMTLAFLFFEGIVLILCGVIMWYAQEVIATIAPGFSSEQVANTVPFLRILMPFIFFISSSALLAGALQSVGHFFIPAFSPVLLNIVFISGLIVCLTFELPVETLCFVILAGGFLQFMAHVWMYFKLHFTFAGIKPETWKHFAKVLTKFFPCLISMSVMEIGLFIDTSFASYLRAGSVSLIHYSNRFMGIPLGVFAVAFSSILLPHFSRVSAYAPKRLSFYLLESAKFVFWVTVPVIFVMGFFAEKIFHTIFLSKKFTLAQVNEAQYILIAFLLGLFFFSLNKILLNIYYSLHIAWTPAIVSIFGTGINIYLNYVLIGHMQATGLALATSISGMVQTLLFVLFLHKNFDFRFYPGNFLRFVLRYCLQLALILSSGFVVYQFLETAIATLPAWLANFLLFKIGFWLWVGPLIGLIFFGIYFSRKMFKIDMHFLD